ncbi:DUF4389 domain-containing protein [Nocardioides houyundeii]|uniref:DUF4389 domain-containing protein n=1 Tax=Nocardioides houyundeii TaxID=2045452 RepID=UPI000DF31513|nr:DUF4389 domain-containing protein [Nocardioides houyundeii]
MDSGQYPVRVDAVLDPGPSRWLWLVKWLLVLPHVFLLAFLWAAYLVLSVVALVAIVITGRYPRGIFEFNVGVMRWSWRVSYYAYSALGTDRYPPFSLWERADYPAHLHVEYPARLSRGLALVKWWLLAIPHYLVLAIFTGSAWTVAANGDADGAQTAGGVGLLGFLVFVAAVVLLFTGRYPSGVFDLVIGLNRWMLRVGAYTGLMTDEYPPFRLDQGGTDPGTRSMHPSSSGETVGVADAQPTSPGTASSPPTPDPSPRWGVGRIIGIVVGSLLALGAIGALVSAAVLAAADEDLRDDGYFTTPRVEVQSPGYAIVSEKAELDDSDGLIDVLRDLLGELKVEATASPGDSVFVGIARTSDVRAYLDQVAHSVVTDVADDDSSVKTRFVEGGAPRMAPGEAGFWVASSEGGGTQSITGAPSEGDWTLVVMKADASSPVVTRVALGATAPVVDDLAGILLLSGLVSGLLAAAILAASLVRRHRHDDVPAAERDPAAGP